MQNEVSLKFCSWNKEHKRLTMASEFFSGWFPSVVNIVSHHTGKTVEFTPVRPGHRLFDPDQWDGEQMVYIPSTPLKGVESLVIYHEY